MDDTNARTHGRLGCRLPLSRDIGEEVSAGAAPLLEHFITTATSIDPDRRAADHYFGWFAQCSQRAGKDACALHPAVTYALLVRGTPSLGYRSSGQMDDGLDTVERCGVDRTGCRVPVHSAARRGRAVADQAQDGHALPCEGGRQRAADQA